MEVEAIAEERRPNPRRISLGANMNHKVQKKLNQPTASVHIAVLQIMDSGRCKEVGRRRTER
jgi:hypothetical protein